MVLNVHRDDKAYQGRAAVVSSKGAASSGGAGKAEAGPGLTCAEGVERGFQSRGLVYGRDDPLRHL